jgi:hypothetical protein
MTDVLSTISRGSSSVEAKEPILITQAGIQLTSVEQVWRMATLLHQSQLVPASFKIKADRPGNP